MEGMDETNAPFVVERWALSVPEAAARLERPAGLHRGDGLVEFEQLEVSLPAIVDRLAVVSSAARARERRK